MLYFNEFEFLNSFLSFNLWAYSEPCILFRCCVWSWKSVKEAMGTGVSEKLAQRG